MAEYSKQWSVVQNKKKRSEDVVSTNSSIISEEFRKELMKCDIQTTKWYHKVLMGQYYKPDGTIFYEDSILKRLALEYQKSMHIKNIDAIILIKNEFMNHLTEQMWIHQYMMGRVYDAQGTPLNKSSPDIAALSVEYIQLYDKMKNTNEIL
jgi:hypothetical protein